MAAEELQSPAELEASLAEYREQLAQVNELLVAEPGNEEYTEMARGLQEVVELTEELLLSAKAQIPEPAPVKAPRRPRWDTPTVGGPAAPRSAAAPQLTATWNPGARCQALYAEDGEWYDATVAGVTARGRILVQFDGYDDADEVDLVGVRPPPAVLEVYQCVPAPKLRKVGDGKGGPAALPKALVIRDEDDEATKARKRKGIKQFKSKQRFQEMDAAQQGAADSWQKFATGKGAKRKAGFLTTLKKDSIFKSPEGLEGKVGVVGSGRGVTDYAEKAKFAAGEFAPMTQSAPQKR